MYHSVINEIEGQHEIATSFAMSQHFHTKRHIELELFVPSNILVPCNKPISKHSHLHEGGGKNPVSNYAASILNATIIRRTCTSKGPLSDFAGHMNNSAYV